MKSRDFGDFYETTRSGYILMANLFRDTITYIMNTVTWLRVKSREFVESERGQKMMMTALWSYSQLCVKIDTVGDFLYEESLIAKWLIDGCMWWADQYDLLTSRRKREPNTLCWISTFKIYPEIYHIYQPTLLRKTFEQHFVYKTNEIYKTYEANFETPSNEIFAYYIKNFLSSNGSKYFKDKETVIIIKKNDVYYSIICNTVHDVDDVHSIESLCNPSTIRILSAMYSHPKMATAIELKVHPGFCMIGNQLLSPAFVRRLLEYQDQPFVFDMEYRIDIIDSEINQHVLNSSNYLFIRAETCGVGSLDTICKEKSKEPEPKKVKVELEEGEIDETDELDESVSDTSFDPLDPIFDEDVSDKDEPNEDISNESISL